MPSPSEALMLASRRLCMPYHMHAHSAVLLWNSIVNASWLDAVPLQEYNGDRRMRHRVQSCKRVDWAAECKCLVEMISKY